MSNFQPRRQSISITKPLIIIIALAYIIMAISLPWPKIASKAASIQAPNPDISTLTWPQTAGQAAFGSVGYGVLATSGQQNPAPIASIAKTMLALSVLDKKPLSVGHTGPTLTMTAADVKLFSDNLAQNGSVVPVALGEKLSEYQMLQALMIPSGDNIADTLATWTFGSVDNYLAYANNRVVQLGMAQTHFADASGLSPQTVSTAHDLVLLGENAMAQPVLAQIVSQNSVNLPVAGTVKNYNTLLGQNNIVGIKTGNTDEAGGCFLFAAKAASAGQNITLIGAIMGDKDRNAALADTKSFLNTNAEAYSLATIVHAGQNVGSYVTPWGESVNIVAKNDIAALLVKNQPVNIKVSLNNMNRGQKKGAQVGSINITTGSATLTGPAVLAQKLSDPPFIWKLFHP